VLQAASAPFVQFVPAAEKNANEIATIMVSTSTARASLTKLIDNALQGDTIILERHGRRVARIVAYRDEDVPPAVRLGAPRPKLRGMTAADVAAEAATRAAAAALAGQPAPSATAT
jgi:antitoxin (DNA-binding transcriptional repressor) of toxin-antitoxin stability system